MFTLSIVRGDNNGLVLNCKQVQSLPASIFYNVAESMIASVNQGDKVLGQDMLNLMARAQKEDEKINCYLTVHISDNNTQYLYLRTNEKAYVMNEHGHTVAKYGCE